MSVLCESGWNLEDQGLQPWEGVTVKIWILLAGFFSNKERVNYLSLGNQADQFHEVNLTEKSTSHILCHHLEKTWARVIPVSLRA